MRDVSEILDLSHGLKLTAANGTDMPYLGWVETTFRLVCDPIIGFNVIEHILTKTEKNKQYGAVTKAFPSLKRNKVKALIQAFSRKQV